jgi:adenylate cyclase
MNQINKKFIVEIESLLKNLSNILTADRSTFYIFNKETNCLESYVAQGLKNKKIIVSLENSIAGHCFKNKSLIIENNVISNKNFNQLFDIVLNYKTVSTICVPIVFKDNMLGVLQTINKFNHNFDNKDSQIVKFFADTIITLLEKHYTFHLISGLQLKNYELSKNQSTFVFPKKTINKFLKNLSNLINPVCFGIYLIENKKTIIKKSNLTLEDKFINEKLQTLKLYYDQINYDNNSNINREITRHFKLTNDLIFPFIIDKTFFGFFHLIIDVKKYNTNIELLKFLVKQFENQIQFNILTYKNNCLNINSEQLINNLKNGVVILDEFLNIVKVNNAFYENFNNTELVHTNILNILRKEIKDFDKICQNAFIDKNVIHKDFSLKNKNISIQIIPNNIIKNKSLIILFSDFPQEIISQKNSDIQEIKPQSKTCSIMFSDIRNFTVLTKDLGAQKTMDLLNYHFEIMTSTVNKHHGLVDKYMGDAFMAIFGLKPSDNLQAFDAISCAIEMVSKLKDLNLNLQYIIEIGIGISTGEVIYGKIGPKSNNDLTVIGEAVNFASRLEKSTKTYGERILVCENTYESVKNNFIFREIDFLYLDKTNTPAKIFAILNKNRWTKKDKLFIQNYQEGIALYKDKRFLNAKKCFEDALNIYPNDKSTQMFLDWVSINLVN